MIKLRNVLKLIKGNSKKAIIKELTKTKSLVGKATEKLSIIQDSMSIDQMLKNLSEDFLNKEVVNIDVTSKFRSGITYIITVK